jgi:hypothetical protein
MSRSSVSIDCPSCAEDVSIPLPVADGGRTQGGDEIHGKEFVCGCCGGEFELLFYPSP